MNDEAGTIGVFKGASGSRAGRPAPTTYVDLSTAPTVLATLRLRYGAPVASRTRVAVIYGGRSSEHAISCVSAGGVMAALDPTRYEVIAIGITADGVWVRESADPSTLAIHDGVLPSVRSREPFPMSPEPGSRIADVVFPVLHGPWGEDGTIQGVLELADLPYVGSGVMASAVAMEKVTMKRLLMAAGLPVGPFEVVTDRQWSGNRDEVCARVAALGFPVFVKPSRAGSSRGITKVGDAGGLAEAIEEARRNDPLVLVEAAVSSARELECGVLAETDGTPTASVIGEIVVSGDHEFYDFAAKYIDGSAQLHVPAAIDPDLAERLRALAVRSFEALGCEGLARVDFFVDGAGEVLVNEVNTMPGFTPTSMFPRLWEATDVTYSEIVDRLIADALRRGTGLR